MEIKRCLLNRRIPAFSLNGKTLIRIGEVDYVYISPIKVGCQSKKEAEIAIEEFEKEFGYPTSMTTEKEWDELVQYCQKNFCLFDFIKLNHLNENAVANATDTNSEGIVFRAGQRYSVDEKYFTGWTEEQTDKNIIYSPKMIFVTVRLIE